jgi:hypothetical protein
MSSAMASSIFRRLSAWRAWELLNGSLLILVTPADDMLHLASENGFDFFRGGVRVFNHVVQQAGRNADRVEIHIGQEAGDLQGVHR